MQVPENSEQIAGSANPSPRGSGTLQRKSVGSIIIRRRPSNASRRDVVSHSFNNMIDNQATHRPDTVITLEDNISSDDSSDTDSQDSLNVMISKAQRRSQEQRRMSYRYKAIASKEA